MTYQPAEDSFLLSEEITRYLKNLKDKNIKSLDMGSGSGIQAKTMINEGIDKRNILCADIDKEAVKELKKQNLKAIKTDLFSKIKRQKLEIIVFNAPYLPEDKYDKKIDTTAGKEGYEIILKFLKQAKSYLAKKGVILILFSNLSKPRIILKFAKEKGYEYEKLAEKNVGFFEKLFVYKFSIKSYTKNKSCQILFRFTK